MAVGDFVIHFISVTGASSRDGLLVAPVSAHTSSSVKQQQISVAETLAVAAAAAASIEVIHQQDNTFDSLPFALFSPNSLFSLHTFVR